MKSEKVKTQRKVPNPSKLSVRRQMQLTAEAMQKADLPKRLSIMVKAGLLTQEEYDAAIQRHAGTSS